MTLFTNIAAWLQIALLAVSSLHPMHVSVTEIEYDEKEKELEIMMRVFIDDFELSVKNQLRQEDLDILNPKNGKTTDQMASDYIKDKFKIALDGKPQQTVYLGHEKESDAFILYIQVPKIKKWKMIQVTNTVITEMHDDQSNLVNVTVRDDVKSLRLTRNTPTDKLTFNYK